MISLPNEILFTCVSQDLDSLRNMRETCSTLRTQIDEIWKTCLTALWEECKSCKELKHLTKERFTEEYFPSFRFVYNWKEGKPTISDQTFSGMLKNGFGLTLKPENNDCFPAFWTNQDNQPYVAFRIGKNLSIFNKQSKLCLGEICGVDDRIKSIFHGNGVFVIMPTDQCFELHFFELSKTHLSFKKKIDLSISCIESFHLIGDYIFIQYPGSIEAISVNWTTSEAPAFISTPLDDQARIFKMHDKVMIFDHSGFQPLLIKEGALEYTPPIYEGSSSYVQDLSFYYADKFAFFSCIMFLDKYKNMIGVIPTENLESSEVLEPFEPGSSAKLVQFNDSVILCSVVDRSLQFHRLKVVDGKIQRCPLNIPVEDKFNYIQNSFVHLDKLFLTGTIEKGSENYLFIFNLKTQCLETKRPINLKPSHLYIIASRLGRLYLSSPEVKKILEIQY